MADPYRYFKRLFRHESIEKDGETILSRPLEWSGEDVEDYLIWRDSLPCQELLRWMWGQFGTYAQHRQTNDDGIDFFQRTYECGMLIHAGHTEYSFRDLLYLLRYARERLASYVEVKAEVTISAGWHMTETRYIYQLQDVRDRVNILLQLLIKEAFPVQLRLEASGYNQDDSDRILHSIMANLATDALHADS